MRVLVTGGGGFLGREIVNHLLERGYIIRSIGRTEQPELMALGVDSIVCDLLDKEALRCACRGMDAFFTWRQRRVYGVAGRAIISRISSVPEMWLKDVWQRVHRLVYTSTPSVVFNRTAICGGDESLPYGASGLSHYARSKALAEAVVLGADCPDCGQLPCART